MELKNQVVCRELSEKIEKLGVVQNSLWYWFYIKEEKLINDYRRSLKAKIVTKDDIIPNGIPSYVSAFTVAELGEILPPIGNTFKRNDRLWYIEDYPTDRYPSFNAKNEADARAKMLIYLIENKLMEIN